MLHNDQSHARPAQHLRGAGQRLRDLAGRCDRALARRGLAWDEMHHSPKGYCGHNSAPMVWSELVLTLNPTTPAALAELLPQMAEFWDRRPVQEQELLVADRELQIVAVARAVLAPPAGRSTMATAVRE